MMSTADSALLAFSSMWVKDLFVPYIRPQATQQQQIWFGRAMSVVGLSIGVALGEAWPAMSGLAHMHHVSCKCLLFQLWPDSAAGWNRQSLYSCMLALLRSLSMAHDDLVMCLVCCL